MSSYVLISAGSTVLIAVLGLAVLKLRSRDAERRRARDSHFKEALQIARSERDAHRVLVRYLDRRLPASRAFALDRLAGSDVLEPATDLPADSPLHQALMGAEPDDCLAIRAGRVHLRSANEPGLLTCKLCGVLPGSTTCVPSLAGGEIIGSVLVVHSRPLQRKECAELLAAVSEAAPVIGNLRNIALAEMRALTDSLTGLANNRGIQETAKRMAAQASRTVTPLAAVLFDLDHFRQINNAYGRGQGDEALAAVGQAIAHAVRDSDFVGRYGGAEFLALLPDTDRQGAITAAEKLRQTIASVRVPGIDGRLSASFGVAVLPDHAGEVNQLLRCADRALYVAKANGRDRVEAFEAPLTGATPSDSQSD
jgi:diguanylate cyclase (GGDEF)-like protein